MRRRSETLVRKCNLKAFAELNFSSLVSYFIFFTPQFGYIFFFRSLLTSMKNCRFRGVKKLSLAEFSLFFFECLTRLSSHPVLAVSKIFHLRLCMCALPHHFCRLPKSRCFSNIRPRYSSVIRDVFFVPRSLFFASAVIFFSAFLFLKRHVQMCVAQSKSS